jgi:hypothetical protein
MFEDCSPALKLLEFGPSVQNLTRRATLEGKRTIAAFRGEQSIRYLAFWAAPFTRHERMPLLF